MIPAYTPEMIIMTVCIEKNGDLKFNVHIQRVCLDFPTLMETFKSQVLGFVGHRIFF